LAGVLPVVWGVGPEIIIGRWLACCAHPLAAWRVLPVSGRVLVALTYTAASYALGLTVLLLLN
jgi:hypothetical protein